MNPLSQRAMGAYYTPVDASTWMARWLLDRDVTTILEPSSGDGSFVDAVFKVAATRGVDPQIDAVELDRSASDSLVVNRRIHRLIHSDFHTVAPFPVDAVIGNPPFVRLRHLTGNNGAAALRAGRQAGVEVDPSGSTWMTFALHAATFLRPGGRLAFVLPADALYVRYARPFWSFIGARFGQVRVVRCRERIFPEILQDVVLLLADHSGSSTKVIESDVYATRADLTRSHRPQRMRIDVSAIVNGEKPFAKALLGDVHADSLGVLLANTVRADTYAKFNIGYVAGHKLFFHPEQPTQRQYRLPARSLIPAVRSGRQLGRCGLRSSSIPPTSIGSLWRPDERRLTLGERAYIGHGESLGVQDGFKTRNRSPWYVVPGVRVPDLLIPVFGELPKIMLNDGGLVASNSLVAGYWKQRVAPETFALCWYSSVTRLGIELSVHALGGGVLVVIPGDADAIRMPVLPPGRAPKRLLDRLERALLEGDMHGAYAVGDDYLASTGWDRDDLRVAREMADSLLSWRVDR